MIWKVFLSINIPWIVLYLLNYFLFGLWHDEIVSVVLWYYFLFMLGLLFYPTVAAIFPRLNDKGYGVAKTLSVLFLFFINWVLTYIGITSFDNPGLFIALLLVLFHTHTKPSRENDLFELIEAKSTHIIIVELIFFLLFIGFLVVGSFSPEIYWGEKPMDFSILNYAIRNSELPFRDPWLAGEVMHYYYFGYYLFSGLIKMNGVSGEIGYALSLATIPALLASGLYSFLLALTKRLFIAVGGALLIVMGSNLKAFSAIVFGNAAFNWSYFWSTTRVFKNHGFAEYPSWSFLFKDLHPHVMGYPFVVTFLLFFYYYFRWGKLRDWKLWPFFSLVWGSLLAINAWDFIILNTWLGFFFLFHLILNRQFKVIAKKAGEFALIMAMGIFFFSPMLYVLSTGKPTKTFFYFKDNNGLYQHFLHHGHWWLIVILMIVPVYFIRVKRWKWTVIRDSFGVQFFLATLALAFLAEFFVFHDRINTIFKTFNLIYILGGICALVSFRFFRFYLRKSYLIVFSLSSIIIVNAICLGTFFQVKSIANYHPFGRIGPSLHGSAYLQKINPSDYQVIRWIQKNIKGTPTIVEKHSQSFDHRGSRISMHTGLPTYLGWEGHVAIRGAKLSTIFERKRKIDFIFDSVDPLKVQEYMLKNKLYFVIVGPFEKSSYSSRGLAKFEQYSDLFRPLVANQNSTLYGVGEFQQFLR
jgi:uncharacterized membrane protein